MLLHALVGQKERRRRREERPGASEIQSEQPRDRQGPIGDVHDGGEKLASNEYKGERTRGRARDNRWEEGRKACAGPGEREVYTRGIQARNRNRNGSKQTCSGHSRLQSSLFHAIRTPTMVSSSRKAPTTATPGPGLAPMASCIAPVGELYGITMAPSTISPDPALMRS